MTMRPAGTVREAVRPLLSNVNTPLGATYYQGTYLSVSGTRGRKYQTGAHLARFPGRAGFYIRWVEARGQRFVVSYTPSAAHDRLKVHKGSVGCILAEKPPAGHPLQYQLDAGDTLTHAGTHRILTAAQFHAALAGYIGKQIGLRIQRGKPGNVFRWRKAGNTRADADIALGQFLVNRDRLKAGLPPVNAPASFTLSRLAQEATAWALSPLSGYSKGWADNFHTILRRLCRHFGEDRHVSAMTPALLGQWADQRATQVSGSTIANEIKVLRAAFKLAVARQYVESEPTAGLKIPKPHESRPKYLTDAQIGLLLDCAQAEDARRLVPAVSPCNGGVLPSMVAAFTPWYNVSGLFDTERIRFLLYTGLRKSQLTSLLWQQYDAARGTLVLESRPDHSEKSKRVNVIPLPRAARAIIDGQPHGSPYIFPNLRGGNDDNLHARFERIAARVKERGGGHIHLHLLRHTALTALLRHTHDIAAVQRYAGHADVKTTARYAWVLDDELKAMTEDFNPMQHAGDPGERKP